MAYQDGTYEPGKLFVGGISWDTTPESMKEYFTQFGVVTDSVVMKDPVTGKPRGFGFITFEDQASVDKVLESKPHMLDNKPIDPKLATIKGQGKPVENTKSFVGGLSFDTDEEKLSQFFVGMGYSVLSVDMKTDEKSRKRGFAFVDFASSQELIKVCQIRHFKLDGKTIEVKPAEPKNVQQKVSARSNEMYPNVMPYNQSMTYGYGGNDSSRFTGMAGTQYSTAGTGYSPYPQYSNTYGEYGTGYGQPAGTSAAMFHNFSGANYGGRGYGQQQTTGYSQESSYPQSRNGFPSTAGSDSYSTGGNNYTYGYSEQQPTGSTQSYRVPNTANSGGSQPRGATSYGQPYGAH